MFCVCLQPKMLKAQEISIYEQEGNYGLKQGDDILCKAKYQEIRPEKDGFFACRKGEKWGFLNKEGKVAIPIKYQKVNDFNWGIAAVQNKERVKNWNYIDKENKTITKRGYGRLAPFQRDFGWGEDFPLSGGDVISKSGEAVFQEVSSIKMIWPNRYLVRMELDSDIDGSFYMDSTAQIISPFFRYPEVLSYVPKVVTLEEAKVFNKNGNTLYGWQAFMDIDFNVYSDWYFKIDFIQDAIVARATLNEAVILDPKTFKPATNTVFRGAEEYEGKLVVELQNGAIYSADFLGNPMVKLFDSKQDFERKKEDELARKKFKAPKLVQRGNYLNREYAYANYDGEIITEWYKSVQAGSDCGIGTGTSGSSMFPVLDFIPNAFFAVFPQLNKKNRGSTRRYIYNYSGEDFSGNRARISLKGETEYVSNECYYFTDNAKFGYIDTLGNEVIPPIYENASKFHGDYAKVQLNGKLGLIDRDGNVTIPIVYEALDYDMWTKAHVTTKKEGLLGVLSLQGEVLLDFQYDKIIYYQDGNSLVEKNGERFHVDNSGIRK